MISWLIFCSPNGSRLSILIGLYTHILKIDDDITQKHRDEVLDRPKIASGKKRSRGPYRKKEGGSTSSRAKGMREVMLEQMTNKLTEHIDRTIEETFDRKMEVFSEACAKVIHPMCHLL